MQFKSITAIIVLLLVVASLLVAGCTSSTSPTAAPTVKATEAATATPKATAAATATPTVQTSSQNDPLITAMINAYKSKGGAKDISWVKLGEPGLLGSVLISNGYDTTIQITRYNTVAKATQYYNGWFANSTDPEDKVLAPVAWGLDYYTAAAGHAPTVKSITTMYVGGVWQQTQTVAQYDDTVVVYAIDGNPSGSS